MNADRSRRDRRCLFYLPLLDVYSIVKYLHLECLLYSTNREIRHTVTMTGSKTPEESTAEPIVTYTCQSGGTHPIPSENTRVLKSGDGGFIVACTCGGEPLEETDEQPHPTRDHLATIDANAPSPSEWLQLEHLADGWYAVDPWEPPEGYTGTRAQRRHQVTQRAKKLADNAPKPIDGEHDHRDKAAREVECPACNATAGRKCKRPSGHRVRKAHADRIDAAEAAGVIDADADTDTHADGDGDGEGDAGSGEQSTLTGWPA